MYPGRLCRIQMKNSKEQFPYFAKELKNKGVTHPSIAMNSKRYITGFHIRDSFHLPHLMYIPAHLQNMHRKAERSSDCANLFLPPPLLRTQAQPVSHSIRYQHRIGILYRPQQQYELFSPITVHPYHPAFKPLARLDSGSYETPVELGLCLLCAQASSD